MEFRKRKIIVAGMSAIAGALAIASLAFACTEAVGSTWYADGTQQKSGPAGTSISAYATGAFTNLAYTLVLGDQGSQPGHATHACMNTVQVLNPTARFANSRGFIGTTVGSVAAGITPSVYQLCFKDNSVANSTGTAGATFTVI